MTKPPAHLQYSLMLPSLIWSRKWGVNIVTVHPSDVCVVTVHPSDVRDVILHPSDVRDVIVHPSDVRRQSTCTYTQNKSV